MNNREKLLQILAELKPNRDLTQVSDIIEGGYLDSFELMVLISQLTEEFDIEIGIDEITPENFNSVQAIVEMVERLISDQ